MPKRRLPRTDEERNAALTAAKTKKDSVPAAQNILTPPTTLRLDTQQPVFAQKMVERGVALSNQTGSTAPLTQLKERARMFISHFIQAFNNGIERGMFTANTRGFYQLDVNSKAVPPLDTEEKIITWGDRLVAGDPLRVATGGAAMAMPTITEVGVELAAFKTENTLQSNLKGAYDLAQEAVEALRPDADSLIVRLWNEIETAYSEEAPASKRRKSREWGVVYIPSPGEAPGPDDFSIMGKVKVQGTGAAIEAAQVKVLETGDIVLSEPNGDYLVPVLPPGTYTLEISKAGFETETITGVVVTATDITELDIEMNGVIVLQGTVHGTVKVAGVPLGGVTVSVVGYPLLTATTNPLGQYSIANIPAMLQNISAQRPVPPPTAPMILPVSVINGGNVVLDFNF
jgi:hypothetical protein